MIPQFRFFFFFKCSAPHLTLTFVAMSHCHLDQVAWILSSAIIFYIYFYQNYVYFYIYL